MRTVVVFVAGMLVGLAAHVVSAQNANNGIVGMNHVGIAVANMEEAVAFYTQKMGFKEAFRTTNEQGQTQLVFIQTNKNTSQIISSSNPKDKLDCDIVVEATITTDNNCLTYMHN